MALCYRQCVDCPMTTTVVVECSDKLAFSKKSGIVCIESERIHNIFDAIVAYSEGDRHDIAFLLRVDGYDVAVECSHLAHDMELF